VTYIFLFSIKHVESTFRFALGNWSRRTSCNQIRIGNSVRGLECITDSLSESILTWLHRPRINSLVSDIINGSKRPGCKIRSPLILLNNGILFSKHPLAILLLYILSRNYTCPIVADSAGFMPSILVLVAGVIR
jgi:hypothetical protein